MIREVTLNGLSTAWHEWGDAEGRPLLCLHPLGQNGGFFDGMAAALGPGWRIASYDQRGHGVAAAHAARDFSQMVDDAAAALDLFGTAAHVAGFSMGGSVASDLAARRGGNMPSLCLAATPAAGLPIFTERACAEARGSIAAIAEETVHRWFGRTSGDPAIEAARRALFRLTPQGFDAAWRAFAGFEGYAARAAALPPTLCLSFGNDLSTPPDVLDGIAETIRQAGGQARRVDIPGAGHMGLLQKPRQVAAALAAFIVDQEEERATCSMN